MSEKLGSDFRDLNVWKVCRDFVNILASKKKKN